MDKRADAEIELRRMDKVPAVALYVLGAIGLLGGAVETNHAMAMKTLTANWEGTALNNGDTLDEVFWNKRVVCEPADETACYLKVQARSADGKTYGVVVSTTNPSQVLMADDKIVTNIVSCDGFYSACGHMSKHPGIGFERGKKLSVHSLGQRSDSLCDLKDTTKTWKYENPEIGFTCK
ncbi:MAG: hypothetical protein WC897_02620 [Candidatus Gracilibacteria bacterium]